MRLQVVGMLIGVILLSGASLAEPPRANGAFGENLPSSLVLQTTAPLKLSFEVASIRPNEQWRFSPPPYSLDSDESFVRGQSLFVVDAPLTSLIAFAYKLNSQYTMLPSLPKWGTAHTLHISARIPGDPTKDEVREMMKTLLSERYHLALHFEKQERSVFALSLLKPGQLGPGLHRFESCKVSGTVPKSDEPITDLGWLPCNTYLAFDKPGGAVFAAARDTTMIQLCAFLSNVGDLGRMVIDRSGIAEPIDFGMEYTKARLAPDTSELSRSEPLESALKNQLGVKLTPIKAQIDVPVIDRLEPLTGE